VATGRGALDRRPGDAPSLRFSDISSAAFERYSPLSRIASEARYGARLGRHVRRTRPDVVLSGNTPLLAQAALWVAARSVGATRVFWVQDLLGRGTRKVLAGRSPLLGRTLGAAAERLETTLLRRSDAAIVITEDFAAELDRRAVAVPTTVVENWAPLDEITVEPKDNPWSRRHHLHDRPVALYSGTLGLKHDPEHLVAVAERLKGSDARLVVITEGRGRDALEAARRSRGLDDVLLLRDYVPYAELPQVLGAADVTLVLLEEEAGTFSVPSKILAYLAAGCPVVAALPAENLATATIERAGAGVVTRPGDHTAFATAVVDLLADDERRAAAGARARAHATAAFAIDVIADRVGAVLGVGVRSRG
jgi:glycosyltransferase involved in cell wall biosynthesis